LKLSFTILRKHHCTGESITNSSVTPDPVFTMGDVDSLRIRVDVDETDVGRVTDGQKVYVMAAAYPGQRFWGRVIRVAGQLGHKNVRTDDPIVRMKLRLSTTRIDERIYTQPHGQVRARIHLYQRFQNLRVHPFLAVRGIKRGEMEDRSGGKVEKAEPYPTCCQQGKSRF
jgi:hypothetical protein